MYALFMCVYLAYFGFIYGQWEEEKKSGPFLCQWDQACKVMQSVSHCSGNEDFIDAAEHIKVKHISSLDAFSLQDST